MAAVSEAFIQALRSEYMENKGGAVGDFFDQYGGIPEYEEYEEQVRHSANPKATVDEIEARLCGHALRVTGGGEPTPAPPPSIEVHTGEEVLRYTQFDFSDWCKHHSCMSRMVIGGQHGHVNQMMEKYGRSPIEDKEFMNYEYSLVWGKYESSRDKVEIEDACSKEDQQVAVERLNAFKNPMLIVGSALWIFTVLAMLFTILAAVASDACSDGSASLQLIITIVLVLAFGIWEIFWIGKLLNLQSQTLFEGIPFVRFIVKAGFMESGRLGSILVLNDLYGKISRASFIGKLVACSTTGRADLGGRTLNGLFQDWNSGVSSKSDDINTNFSLSVVSLILFIVPIFLQVGRMLRSLFAINSFLGTCKDKPAYESLGIASCIDDFASVADWALLRPPSNIFAMGAVPLELTDERDSERVWDLLRTKAYMDAANLFPDAIIQLWLMSINFCFVVGPSEPLMKLQLVLSIIATFITTFIKGVLLIKQNFVLTVLIGLAIVTSVSIPLFYVIAAFTCAEDEFVTRKFVCLPI